MDRLTAFLRRIYTAMYIKIPGAEPKLSSAQLKVGSNFGPDLGVPNQFEPYKEENIDFDRKFSNFN